MIESANNGIPEKVNVVMKKCEIKDDIPHRRLSLLLKNLWDLPGVNRDELNEIEELYIQKTELICSFAYLEGYNEGKNYHR
ncbi:hypothetical protein [Paenibacillus hubeiensis]|uniref:hypothetical protein n=1 Tax=Paenibacillus hubeiensis TaxID=3077330 RepID=UPI0031BB98D7